MTAVNPREARKPEFPATVHAYSDALQALAKAGSAGLNDDEIADATGRVRSNVRRDMHKLREAGVVSIEHSTSKWTVTEKGQRWVAGMAVASGEVSPPADGAPRPGDLIQVHPNRLRPDPDQPRKAFDPVALADLAVSIRDKGLLLPILARPEDDQGTMMIIAGERRWRASMTMVQAGHWPDDRTVPVKVATPTDEAEAFELAVIENMQRDQLNHMEMGQSFERMGTTGGKSNAEIARIVGKTPEFVQQHRRLIRLDPDMQAWVAEGRLSMHEALKLLAGPTRGGATPAPQPEPEDQTPDLWEEEGAETDFLMAVSGKLMVTWGEPLHPNFYSLVRTLRSDGLSVDDTAARVASDRKLKPLAEPETLLDQPTAAAPVTEEPVEETPWTRGGFRMVKELRATGPAIPRVCSRAPVARLFMQGDAFNARYRVQVVVDFGGGHTIESTAIPGAEQGHIAVAIATDDILARWPAGRSEPPRPFIEWLDKMTGKPNVVAGKFCENAEQADAQRAARGWTTSVAKPDPSPQAEDGDAVLKPRLRLILIELAHKVAAQKRPLDPTGDAEWSGDAAADYLAFGAFVGSYWLDQGFNELASLRLVRAAHQPAGQGILAALTPAGVERMQAEAIPLPPTDFQVRDAQGAVGEAGLFDTPERYATAWLAAEARVHPEGPADASAASTAAVAAGNEDPWLRDEAAIAADAALLEKARDWTGNPDPLNDVSQLLADLGVHEARVHPDGWLELANVEGAVLAEVSVDTRDRLPTERAAALEHLIAWAVNTALEAS